jgi:hypothetical protein
MNKNFHNKNLFSVFTGKGGIFRARGYGAIP